MDVNILFMGSSDFSVPMINALFQSCGVKSVVTQPDKPAGRGKRIESPVVKRIAEELGIPVYQPNKLIREDILAILNKHRIDLIVVAAYGKILPAWLLDHPKYGAINVHASLLPKYRGASPIQAAILNGDQTTGVTIMKMDVGLDTGDILGWKKMKIEPNETAGSLSFKLAKQGAQLLVDTINDFILGRLTPKKQKSEDATFTRLIKKEDGELDLQLKAVDLERKIRAYNPWPVCYIKCESGPLRIFEAEISAEKLAPFQRGVLNRYPVIGTATTALLLKSVQPAGKKIMDGKSFLNGTKEWLGTR
jgi:methionyl-tRNA formyltransferase